MLTKEQCKAWRTQLTAKLHDIETAMGVKLTLGTCRFGATATFKLEVAPMNDDGTVVSATAATFKAYANLYGLKADDLGRTFRMNGTTYTIVGLNTRCRKFPVQGRSVRTGKVFKFSNDTVKMLLNVTK